MIDLDEIRPKISGEVLSTWRAYHRELSAHGVTREAENLYAEIRVLLDVVGDELDEVALHHLAFIRGRRPPLISRQAATTAAPPAPECGSQSEPKSPPKPRPAPKRKPMSDDALVAMHIEAQALIVHGETPAALNAVVDLHRTLGREWDLDVWDEDGYQVALDVLHNAAWPDASTRPARLWIEPCGDPRE